MTEINGRESVHGQFEYIDPYDKTDRTISFDLVTLLNYLKLNGLPAKKLDDYKSFLTQIGFVQYPMGNDIEETRHYHVEGYKQENIVAYDGDPLRVTLFWDPVPVDRNTKNGTVKFTPNTGITTKIFYPIQSLLDQFYGFFNEPDFARISELEITFDFYTDDSELLVKFFRRYLFLKYNRNPPLLYKNTFYLIHTKKGKRYVKTMKIYTKDTVAGSPVRMELTLHRPSIKDVFDLANLKQQVSDFDFAKYFDFKFIDRGKFLERLTEQHRRDETHRLTKSERNNPRYKKYHMDLWEATAMSATEIYFINHYYIADETEDGTCKYFDDYIDIRSVNDINHVLKQLKKGIKKGIKKVPSKVLHELTNTNDRFFSLVNGRSFLA